MAGKNTLNAKNLQELGAERLAELLIEVTAGDAAKKRLLRMEIVANDPKQLAHEVRKRLSTIAKARSFVDWRRAKSLAADLEAQRLLIVEKIAPNDPKEALDLLWRFLSAASPIYDRLHDRSDRLPSVFRAACDGIAIVAAQFDPEPVDFADSVFEALLANDYGQYDDLIKKTSSALGQVGLEHLKERVQNHAAHPVEAPDDDERVVVGWSSNGPIYADMIEASSQRSMVRSALQEIADAQGDVDAFIRQFDETARKSPRIAAEIGLRLVSAGRAEEALAVIEAVAPRRRAVPNWIDLGEGAEETVLEDVQVAALEALGRDQEAQHVRWGCFEDRLSARHLRDYLKRLPDFDDIDAEEKALTSVESQEDYLSGLMFLMTWPALDRAARVVIAHAGSLDGDDYHILTEVAEVLAEKHPLAATLALRAMIDFSLERARSSRYKHTAKHLMECADLSKAIVDYGRFETHDDYMERLRASYAGKRSFWSQVET